MVIGILALQGAFGRHARLLNRLGVRSAQVRDAAELAGCDGLIIPGGESTAMSRLLTANGLLEPLQAFAREHPVMGTCAGLILMAEQVDDPRITPLALLPVRVERNHYGSQLDSFETTLSLRLSDEKAQPPFTGVFIRAPAIVSLGPELKVIAEHERRPVMVAGGRHLGLSFHPELTDDTRIHRYWLERFYA